MTNGESGIESRSAQPGLRGQHSLWLGAAAVLLLAGCDARTTSYEVPPPPAATASLGANDETLRRLTSLYRAFCRTNQSGPATFRDFAAAARVRIPMTPPGFVFALNTNTLEVVLVRR
jgi:hypothetical protein